jgi:hypothetical protein
METTYLLKHRKPVGKAQLQEYQTNLKNNTLTDSKKKVLKDNFQRKTYFPYHNSFQMDIIDIRYKKLQ